MTNTEMTVQLRSISEQVREITGLLEESDHCIDAICHIRAVQQVLNQIMVDLLEHHLASCVATVTHGQRDINRKAMLADIQELFCWANRVGLVK